MGVSHQHVHELIERTDGPPLIAYWLGHEATTEYGEGDHTYDWHRHLRGQFFCIETGMVQVHTKHGSWLLPPHRAGWMPPGELHTVTISGGMTGWGVFISPTSSTVCPSTPA